MDSPLTKKSEVMDMPIYLQFIDGEVKDPHHRWFVIEEKSGVDKGTDDELRPELWIHKSEQDRVRVVKLPNIGYATAAAPFLVAKSRLFFVGGVTVRGGWDGKVDNNGILYIDLQQRSPISWSRFATRNFKYVRTAVVSDDGDWIYLLTTADRVLRFNCHHLEDKPEAFPLPFTGRPIASTGSKMLLYNPAREAKPGLLGFCHLESRSWEEICSFPVDKDPFTCWRFPKWSATVVLAQDFVIDFGSFHPRTGMYEPALYVFDIRNNVWLPEPVQGLSNDGIVLPDPDVKSQWLISYTALMQVRRDELKFALVWSKLCNADDDQTEVHWSKFILHIQNNDDQDVSLPFQAVDLSYGICYGGNTHLIKSTVG
ncbi:PREDICTED: uncharacterized protein LOC101303230 [Fragaria vesca subsp. vesca]|uniref:uncharacterized protein LOC101303230 n=1 Tax=Fragaria vesca subsp. vesca TaxID=101020 RepID=UPI0002C3431F|nr:PREDICTED: uncharacterized protein LOC101303230 [Fragaria vesca subsp. vesca]